MAVPTTIADLSTTAAANSPAGSESIGTSLDDYMRAIQAIIKQGVSKGSDIASAGTITPVATSSYFVVTGTTGITAIGETYSWVGRTIVLKFSDALLLTHSSGLILPGAANITTVAGAVLSFVNESAGVWRCIGPSIGANTFTGIQRWAKGADVASANALTLGTDGNYFDITGTTAITSIGTLGVGTWIKLHFDAALTLTHHATDLILPGGANITTAAGDEAEFVEYATGDWRCTSYTKANGQAVVGTGAGYPMDLRLTLTSGNPVVDIGGAATTVYCTPYVGNKIALYDGSSTWNIRTSAEFSLAIGTVTAGLPYDVFCYDNAGTPTLEKLAWSSNTARATALTRQDGVYVKSGATTRRYLGTFACYDTTNSADSASYRLLWNYYNRRPRGMAVVDTTNSWTYTTATWRQANAVSTNVLNIITGVAEDMASISVMCQVNNATGAACSVGVGINSTTVNSAQINGGTAASNFAPMPAHYRGVLPIGLCAVNWLEISAASGTTTWYGDNNLTYTQSGIYAEIMS